MSPRGASRLGTAADERAPSGDGGLMIAAPGSVKRLEHAVFAVDLAIGTCRPLSVALDLEVCQLWEPLHSAVRYYCAFRFRQNVHASTALLLGRPETVMGPGACDGICIGDLCPTRAVSIAVIRIRGYKTGYNVKRGGRVPRTRGPKSAGTREAYPSETTPESGGQLRGSRSHCSWHGGTECSVGFSRLVCPVMPGPTVSRRLRLSRVLPQSRRQR